MPLSRTLYSNVPSPIPPESRYSHKLPKRTCTLTLLVALLLLVLYLILKHHKPAIQILPTVHWNPTRTPSDIRIAKAAIQYAHSDNRSLALHSAHNAAFGYSIHILRTPIVHGFANTLLWLQHIIVSEITTKNVEERVEWILFVNPSSVIVSNPEIPLHIFVPAPHLLYSDAFKALTIIGSKRNSVDMNTATFFVRVSTLSIRFLTLAMSAVYEQPERDWGADIVGSVMRDVLEREEWRDKVVWMPREWWDGHGAVFRQLRDCVEGLLEMDDILRESESEREVEKEAYPSRGKVDRFWNNVVEAKQVLTEAKDRGYSSENGEYWQEIRDVKDAVELWTWDVEGMRRKVKALKEMLGIGEVVGFETVIG